MKIVISAGGPGLDAPASPVFGRCPTYMFVDTDTLASEAIGNPAASAGGGAGIQAAQFVIQQGAQAVLSGNVGPNAFQVFGAAGVPIYLHGEDTVRQAVEAFKVGKLQASGGANVAAHAGMSLRRGTGRGMGRRMSAPAATPAPAGPSREEQIASLQKEAAELRQRMADIGTKLDELEKGAR